MCRVYLLFTRLTLTSALWRMLGIQGGGHFSKHASKHNIFRRDAIVDQSERLLGKCRVLRRSNSAGLRIFHWGALVPSQYGCISQLHTIQDDIFSICVWWDRAPCSVPPSSLLPPFLILCRLYFVENRLFQDTNLSVQLHNMLRQFVHIQIVRALKQA